MPQRSRELSVSIIVMLYVNSYVPPPVAKEPTYGPAPYDINFVFPVKSESLETTRVRLTPFIPSLHAELYFNGTVSHPDLYNYLPFSFPTLSDFLRFLEAMQQNPNNLLFAIIDKTRSDAARPEMGGGLAGMIGLVNTSVGYLAIDIGPIVVIPSFQRTHVTSNAMGILLRYCMELPTASPYPGLGLRRVAWMAKPDNGASIKVAERVGMKKEGLLRWTYVTDGPGPFTREGAPNQPPGRDCILLSVTWEDWENGGREVVQRAMDR